MGMRPGHKRLQPGEEDFRYDLQSILGNAIHIDGRRVVDRFLRYEPLLQVKSTWTPLDFEGKRTLEIGSEPLLGAGPIAVYHGATEYVCVEPRYQPAVLESGEVWTRLPAPLPATRCPVRTRDQLRRICRQDTVQDPD